MNIDVVCISNSFLDSGEFSGLALKISSGRSFDAQEKGSLLILLTALIRGGILRIAISLEGLEYIDSRGIGTLINAAKLIREKNGDLVLYSVPEHVAKVLGPVNLHRYIKIFDEESEALEYLKSI